MPVNYLAGTATAGLYSGVIVADETALLTEIMNALIAGGQTVTDNIAASKEIIARGSDQGDFCDKIYKTSFVSGIEYSLTLQGDNTVNGGTLSTPILEIPFYANGSAKLFVTSDEGAECLTIINPGNLTKGFHAGWLDRRRSVDKGAWMIGYLDIWMSDAYVAQDVNGNDWQEIFRYYYSSTESKTSPRGGYHLLFDAGCASMFGSAGTSATSATTFNYRPWLGQTDSITGNPTLLPYGYLQGNIPYNSYSVPDPNKGQGLHNAGFVRFARTGLSFLDPGDQCREGTATFVSAGPSGVDGFQGFQIAS